MMRLEIDENVHVEEFLSDAAIRRSSVICVPSPFTSEVRIRAEWQGDLHSLDIHDVTGRVVRSFDVGCEGGASLSWDGTDDIGRRVMSGAYFVTLRTGTSSSTKKILLVR